MAPTLDDIHPDIIQTHILPLLDGPSLSSTAAASPHLKTLCSDDNLWSQICTSTWPSIAHPRVQHAISTFPAGHRSFFEDSFPALIADVSRRNPRRSWSAPKSDSDLDRSFQTSSELISAVDLRYLDDVVYSRVNFTKITPDFLSSAFGVELNDDVYTSTNRSGSGSGSGSKDVVNRISRSIDLTVDEIAGADKLTLSHLKQSVTLNWILIDPTRKRACNLSSIKPVFARQDWVTNETLLRFVTVLPGSDPNEIVKCGIKVVLGVGEKGVGLYVKEVVLKLMDLDSGMLSGREFLVISRGAFLEENNVRRRKVVDDEERLRCYKLFKEMKREKKKWMEKEERKKEMAIQFNYAVIFVSFFLSVYFLFLLW
ncbi:hypothetical protein SSX86_010678 [Deinandra increscens subsp. villosa]|uniref:F-box domain-containing protein n=1 Tax=Deinandra increscens subsp. villosa TaxID=3103831 RepID=A0AAP0DC67_9ASTR